MAKIYLLSPKKIVDKDIIHLPIFDIKYLPFSIDFNNYNALLFTSKNSIESLIKNGDNLWKQIPSYAISDMTAAYLKKAGGNLVFNAKAKNGNEFAKLLIEKLKNKKVLYIRAKKVASNIVEILKSNDILCDELVSYETICKKYDKGYKIEDGSIIIFSSPSSVKCFLKNFSLDSNYKYVAIGETTAKELPKNLNYNLPKEKSLPLCISLAKKLI